MTRRALPIIFLLFLLGACATQTAQQPPAEPQPAKPQSEGQQTKEPLQRPNFAPMQAKEHMVKTMVAGLDQFPKEDVLVLNTGHGPFVVGPGVDNTQIAEIHAHLIEAHDRVIRIKYIEVKATRTTLAHRRVTEIIIEEVQYLLPR